MNFSASNEVIVVRTGVANLASVFAAFQRIGGAPRLTTDAEAVRKGARVLLPGVGSFGAAMATLRSHGLAQALTERVAAGKPTCAVCVGLQVLCKESDESPGVLGLGIIAEKVERFTSSVRVPHMGWNRVQPEGIGMVEPGYAYFANSYRLVSPPKGYGATFAEHGGRFVASFERGAVLACQFHPELSGAWGLSLLKRWMQSC